MRGKFTSTGEHLAQQIVRIQPSKGFIALGLGELWEYRDLLWFNVLKNIKSKYRQMALGPLWIILQPVINMVLFTFIFGNMANLDSGGIPYPLLTCQYLYRLFLFVDNHPVNLLQV